MLGLTALGLFHTVLGLVALVCGALALLRYRQITPQSREGRIYLLTTLVTALTALGIFQRGGFGVAHALALLTLAALAVGWAAGRATFGRLSPYLQAAAYSATILFHLVPGVVETTTRLPPSAPLFASPEAAGLQPVLATLALLYLVGLALQLRWLRTQRAG